MKIPEILTYKELDHEPDKFPAFSPDYEESDMGKNFDLTFTLFGFQVGTDEAIKIRDALNSHILFSMVHDELKKIKHGI